MRDSTFKHRPDIDGLRAVAVLLVVLYHVGVPGITGGFVGVDVFFVISGFLITSLLVLEAETRGRISLADFYARRVRRLFPALMVVVLVTLLLGAIWLLPVFGEQTKLAKSAVATSIYLSNFYFWKFTGNYFDGPAELEPLLHTWSLAVEEQFYLFWPLLIIGVVAFCRPDSPRFRRNVGLAMLASAGRVARRQRVEYRDPPEGCVLPDAVTRLAVRGWRRSCGDPARRKECIPAGWCGTRRARIGAHRLVGDVPDLEVVLPRRQRAGTDTGNGSRHWWRIS